jgi:hypothetical protein
LQTLNDRLSAECLGRVPNGLAVTNTGTGYRLLSTALVLSR